MDEQGIVISTNGNKARVLINRHAACGDCGACHIGKEKMTMETVADNKIDAKEGEDVLVHMETINVLKATGIAYGFPFLLFVIGLLLGWFLAPIFNLDQVITSFFMGIGLTIISFLVIYFLEKRGIFNTKYKPIIIKILN